MSTTIKSLAAIGLLLFGGISTQAATTDNDTITLRLKGMRCGECAHKVKNVLRKDAGVGPLDFNLERRTVTIVYDKAATSLDSIQARLKATGRFKPSPYSPNDTIRRGYGQRIDDMHCRKCADRITARLQQINGIDSVAPKLAKHYVFIRYDANRTCKADIRQALNQAGYTPCNYYTSPKIGWLYLLLPAEQANQDTQEKVLAMDGVEDVNVNERRKTMAITFFNDETSADKLLADIQQAGIQAALPKPHVCKENQVQPQ